MWLSLEIMYLRFLRCSQTRKVGGTKSTASYSQDCTSTRMTAWKWMTWWSSLVLVTVSETLAAIIEDEVCMTLWCHLWVQEARFLYCNIVHSTSQCDLFQADFWSMSSSFIVYNCVSCADTNLLSSPGSTRTISWEAIYVDDKDAV